MSFRQNSVFKVLPQKATSLRSCVLEQQPKENQLSNYTKVMNIDGVKNGDISKLQQTLNCSSQQKRRPIQARFQNKLLNFLLVAVKNQYKSSFKKKHSLSNKSNIEQSIFKTNKTQSLGECNSQQATRVNIGLAKNKGADEQNGQNCLKNKKLLNLRVGRTQRNNELNFVNYNKHLLKDEVICKTQKKHSQPPSAHLATQLEENQDCYLTSQLVQSKNLRVKTQEFSPYLLLERHVRQYLSLEANSKKESLVSKSEGIRVFSAMELFNEPKKTVNFKWNSRQMSFERRKVSNIYDSGFITKSLLQNKNTRKSINDPFKVKNLPKRQSIYSRSKRNNRSSQPPSLQSYFDNLIVYSKKETA